jgi:hypothetical protein
MNEEAESDGTPLEQMQVELDALKEAVRIRERLPRFTPEWEQARIEEELAISRVRHWVQPSSD